MKRKWGITLVVLGTLMLVSAVALALHNRLQEQHAADVCEQYLEVLTDTTLATVSSAQDDIPPQTTPTDDTVPEPMATVVIDGREFIGYLSVPSLGLELPVLSQTDDEGLQTAPCRYTGSITEDNLVIGAHNYSSHFGRLTALSVGDEIVFTDVCTEQTVYRVADMETLDPYAVPDLTAGEYPLTLFTCTYGGAQRIVVRCDRSR